MQQVINTFLQNLFGTNTLTLYSDTDILVSIDLGYVLTIAFITFCCIVVSTIFYWFFHILFEKECCK